MGAGKGVSPALETTVNPIHSPDNKEQLLTPKYRPNPSPFLLGLHFLGACVGVRLHSSQWNVPPRGHGTTCSPSPCSLFPHLRPGSMPRAESGARHGRCRVSMCGGPWVTGAELHSLRCRQWNLTRVRRKLMGPVTSFVRHIRQCCNGYRKTQTHLGPQEYSSVP